MATYLSFVVCILVDFTLLFSSAKPNDHVANPTVCSSCNNPNITSYTFKEYFYDVNDVITLVLSATQTNFTGLADWTTGSKPDVCSSVSLMYDITVWACYQPYGCSAFPLPSSNQNNVNYWHYILTNNAQSIQTDMCTLSKAGSFIWDFFDPHFLSDVS